jgi:hypothetical protein
LGYSNKDYFLDKISSSDLFHFIYFINIQFGQYRAKWQVVMRSKVLWSSPMVLLLMLTMFPLCLPNSKIISKERFEFFCEEAILSVWDNLKWWVNGKSLGDFWLKIFWLKNTTTWHQKYIIAIWFNTNA